MTDDEFMEVAKRLVEDPQYLMDQLRRGYEDPDAARAVGVPMEEYQSLFALKIGRMGEVAARFSALCDELEAQNGGDLPHGLSPSEFDALMVKYGLVLQSNGIGLA